MITPRSEPWRRWRPFAGAALLFLFAATLLGHIDRPCDEETQKEDAARWTAADRADASLSTRLSPWIFNRFPERLEIAGVNPFETLPPDQYLMEYLSSILLGGFKALAVDYLWVRECNLEKERKFEEIPLLLEAIARLQPKQVEVWKHNAWNMAYNIAAQYYDPAQKWLWVQKGLEYVHKGLRTNPNNPQLEFYIGWIFWHRIPQDDRLVRRCVALYGRDPFDLASEWFALAQAHNLTGGLPVDAYTGLVADALYRRYFVLVNKGWFESAYQTLFRCERHCAWVNREYPGNPDFWNLRIQWLKQIEAVLPLERRYRDALGQGDDGRLAGNGERQRWEAGVEYLDLSWFPRPPAHSLRLAETVQLSAELVAAYRDINRGGDRFSTKPMYMRQLHLLMVLLDHVFGCLTLPEPAWSNVQPLFRFVQEVGFPVQPAPPNAPPNPYRLHPSDPFRDFWRLTRDCLDQVWDLMVAERQARLLLASSRPEGAQKGEELLRDILPKYENLRALYECMDHPAIQKHINEIRALLHLPPEETESAPAGGTFGEDKAAMEKAGK